MVIRDAVDEFTKYVRRYNGQAVVWEARVSEVSLDTLDVVAEDKRTYGSGSELHISTIFLPKGKLNTEGITWSEPWVPHGSISSLVIGEGCSMETAKKLNTGDTIFIQGIISGYNHDQHYLFITDAKVIAIGNVHSTTLESSDVNQQN